MMKIGYDAKKAVKNWTGIGNYSRRCINAIAHYEASICPYLFAPQMPISDLQDRLPANVLYLLPRVKFLYELWRLFGAVFEIKKHQIEIFHGLSNELPLFINSFSSCKSIVTIHDLIFLEHPETYKRMQYWILKIKTYYACKNADRIIAISNKTKEDIIKWYNIPDEKISIVYQSIDNIYFETVSDDQKDIVRQKYDIHRPYVICVGSIETRKNQLTVVRALSKSSSGLDLYLIGRATPYQKEVEAEIKRLNLSNRVHILNFVATTDLPALYQMATALCLMSIYEGFGLPVAEAAASGIPVITANGSCLEEAGGPNAIYLSPYDHISIAREIDRLAANPKFTKEKGLKCQRYAEQFKDEYLSVNLLKIYKSLI